VTDADVTYGARGTLGFIDLSTCVSLTPEVFAGLPPKVNALFSRIRLPAGEVTPDALSEMVESEQIERAAHELADAGVEAIVFACTSASLLFGAGFDQTLTARIEEATGIQATTTTSAVVRALSALGARKISVGTPYLDEINERERDFLSASGFTVVNIAGLGLTLDRDIGAVPLERIHRLAHEVGDVSADALFLSCTNLGSQPLIRNLEAELQRPVVTSNSASLWQALGLIGALPARPVLGELASAPYPSHGAASKK
jgi:maleate isomerase